VVGLPNGDVSGGSAESIQKRVIQHAVHLATEKTVGEQSARAGPPTPSTSPADDVALVNSQEAMATEAMKKYVHNA